MERIRGSAAARWSDLLRLDGQELDLVALTPPLGRALTPSRSSRVREAKDVEGSGEMKSSSRTKVERSLLAITAICVALVPTVAWADAGIPMLFVVWPGAWLVLVPVVLIETFFARKLLRLSFGRSLKVVFVANLVSTGVGIPITWLGLLLVELPAGLLGAAFESHRWVQVALFPFEAAWLGPMEQLWMGGRGCDHPVRSVLLRVRMD
jgi:hypothetical protein